MAKLVSVERLVTVEFLGEEFANIQTLIEKCRESDDPEVSELAKSLYPVIDDLAKKAKRA